jgi:Ner family transcriptional regulator
VRKRETSPPEDWHPEDVKSAIRKTGISMSTLAQRNGKAIATICMALKRQSAPAQEIIAKHLGIPPQTIWPTRYDAAGNALDRRGSNGCRTSCDRMETNSQKRGTL